MGDSLLLVVLPILLGAVVMSGSNVVTRHVMKGQAISSLQCLILFFGSATMVFGVVYLVFWGFTMPEVLPGMWTAVACGAAANTFIQFFDVKAASIDKGEVSLTAPLQAMTPGLITGLALLLGEYPSRVGIAGICLMVAGSYVLLWERGKTPEHWYEYFGPAKRVALLAKLGRLSKEERNKTIVVTLSLGSACMGTIGLLFVGLYTRRAVTMQGLILASMALVGILCAVYTTWYVVKPDARPMQRFKGCFRRPILLPVVLLGVLDVLHVLAIQPTFRRTLVAYVGTLKRFNILMSVVLGFLLFHEEDFKKRLWAAILIVAGAMLIATDDLPARLATKMEWFGL